MTISDVVSLKDLMEAYHKQNRGDIDELKETTKGLVKTQDIQIGMMQGIKGVLDSVKWILGVLAVLISIFLGIRTFEKRAANDNPSILIQEQPNKPASAINKPAY